MAGTELATISFFVILLAGLLFSEIFSRLHFPLVLSLILAGIIVGPYGLELLEINPTIEFLGEIGLVFLMFMTGLETRLSTLNKLKKNISIVALLNGAIPFAAGLAIALLFGYSLIVALLLGTIFISSSIAVVVPFLKANKLIRLNIGNTIIGATILADVASLIVLSILLQTHSNTAGLPLLGFYTFLGITLFAFRWLMLKIHKLLLFGKNGETKEVFEKEFRIIFVMLLGTVIVFQLLGLHAIIAGFFVGLILSDVVKSKVMKAKLHVISYGIFIPVFFVVVGANTDITVFSKIEGVALFTLVIIATSMLAKFISGWIGGKIIGLSPRKSALLGASTIPQLSTTLAVVSVGASKGILDQDLVAAMVALSIVTTFTAPFLIKILSKEEQKFAEIGQSPIEETGP